ncbi:MAG: pyridine nucleotide-disulfide oxidoreductase [Candidatus Abyssobacteria bacterium SURF_5]|uniref:Pyridine nucleotide-disulfide oxidoreductase n=1 Tax=Abyssobacteria bacterium (strain SURF_5) TaxID=2093360 RepID=A0A3A4NBX1_ABYX5|nr:MAG: pyridine nucleotide-disulfide oxidoreductase [Candidatus Abyssubacteria bacterium SURF_5]
MKEARKIVIIGGVACGPKAAARARRRDPHAEITVIERGSLLSYAGCGIPYYIGGAIPEYDGLRKTQYGVVRDEQFFDSVKGIRVRTRTLAEAIDRKNKTVQIRNLQTESIEQLHYDKLVLATGASPARPPIEGLALDRVFFVHYPQDALRMRELIEGGEVDKAVLIGAGRISLEIAESLFAHAVDAVIVELEDCILPTMLDPEIAATVAGALRDEGVQVLVGEKVVRILANQDGQACGVVTGTREIPADMVVVATGVKPNVQLAAAAGLKIGSTGAISVNEYLQTNDPDIYAGGDCVECDSLVTGKKLYAPLGSTANRHGRVIGDNITGGKSVFPGVVGTSVMKAMGVNISSSGITERQARAMGYSLLTSVVPWMDRAHYFPGGKALLIKLVADAQSGRLLGGQIVGPGDVTKRVDVIATALSSRAKIEEVANLDLGYAPPYSTALDSIAHAANVLLNKRDGLAKTISAAELRARIERDEDFVLLDVREMNEVEKSRFENPRVCSLPLSRLRAAKDDIPSNKELICFCQLGMRSYEACRTLAGMGFDDVKFLEGGLRFWLEGGD